MEIKSSLLNDKDFQEVKKSLIRVSEKDGKEKFRVRVLEYINDSSTDEDDIFFFDMLEFVRFLNPDTDAVAYTTPEHLIYLNCPCKEVGESSKLWDFVYDHECLHQLWDTFGVAKRIIDDQGSYDHNLLNIASDCVINDYLYYYRKKARPNDLITPEHLKDKYGVEYDRKKDTQYTLYLKLLKVKQEMQKKFEEMMNDPVIKKALEDMENQQNGQQGQQSQQGQSGQGQGGQSGNSGGNKSDEQRAEDAAKQAEQSANNAQDAADKAKDAGDGDAGEKQGAADKAKDAAGRAKEHAEKAKEAAGKGDKKTAKEEADKAEAAAKEAAEANKQAGGKPAGNGKDGQGDGKDKKDDQGKDGQGKDGKQSGDSKDGSSEGGKADNKKSDKDGKGYGTGGDEEKPEESEVNIEEIKKKAEKIIDKYKDKISGDFGEFINRCKKSVELKESGLGINAPRGTASWNEKMNSYVNTYVKQRIFQKKRQYQSTYSRVKRGSGYIKYGEPIQPGRKIREEKLTINTSFYIDKSGSMGGSIDNVFKAAYIIAESLKKQFSKDSIVDEVSFKMHAFNHSMYEIKFGSKTEASGGTMGFHEILQYIKDHTNDYLINIIITDAEFSINEPEVEKFIKDIEGMVIFITNNDNATMKKLAKQYENTLYYILADSNFTLGDKK